MSNEPQPVTDDPATDIAPTPAEPAAPPAAPAESAADASAPAEDNAPAEANAAAEAGQTAQAARGGSGPLAARGLGIAKPASPSVSTEQLEAVEKKAGKPNKKKKPPRPRIKGEKETPTAAAPAAQKPQRVAVPSLRAGLSDDLQAELDAELAAADIESMLSGSAGMSDRKEALTEGTRISGQVLKIHQDSVYIALGGPDEGVIPFEQFKDAEPAVGSSVEVMVRGFNRDDGLYMCSLPGSTIDVADWSDLEEGSVVEAVVTGHNTGGLECKVGGVRGFMPISQIAEYRVEDASEFVDQKFVCLVTEANERRGNLVLSRRAILEREREQKRAEQLAEIEPGDVMEGVVRSVKDFGAFVDLGALDGLIHVSKLSWDRVKHPSEVLEVGQKVKVKLDSVDKETGKISLSYRDLLENPWDTAEAEFAIGSVHKGTVSRIASFGCFVRLGAGVEGLVHVSELAHHRVSKVDAFVSEGQEVDVKVLSFDRESQKIGLSIKAAQQIAEDSKPKQDEVEEPQREVAVKPTHDGPLKGGNNRDTGGERFGLRW
ncbi:S1 RNA-binding domain-containing protein [Stieleria sp. ICT_E10.1]|uniref:30S ribosomal protein S1 n=1 Tax=Stieleria sedimenti TaxID=2976331 RepID=UPI00217F2C9E|nr:S1 RNA-binding domain-containing protein [Stieleria sedimenti]MCS7470379.1 S1 RNA-binding domain-containing protein [Stieleria sedimenti]